MSCWIVDRDFQKFFRMWKALKGVIDMKVPEIDRNGPSLFALMGEKQNAKVLNTFIFISVLIVVVAFGTFYAGRWAIPKIWTQVSRADAGNYAAGISCVITHIVVFAFIIYARRYDLEQERLEKEQEAKKKKE